MGPACAIAAVLTLPLSGWVSVVFAGIALGLSAPRWLGRWRKIAEGRARLGPMGLRRSRLRSKKPGGGIRLGGTKKGVAARAGKGPPKKAASAKESFSPAVVAAGRRGIGDLAEFREPVGPSASPEKPDRGHHAKSPAGLAPGARKTPRAPAVLMDIGEIRQRLLASNDAPLPDSADWARTEPPEEKVRGYRLVSGSGGDLTVITDAEYRGCGPLAECWTGEGDITAPPEPPSPFPPSAVTSGEALAAAGPEAVSDAPPEEMPPGEVDLVEVDDLEVDTLEVYIEDVEIPPEREYPGSIGPEAGQFPQPAVATGLTFVSMSGGAPMPVTYPSGLSSLEPALPGLPEWEEVLPPDVAWEGDEGDEGGESILSQRRFYPGLCLPPLDLLYPADAQSASMSPEDLIDCGILIEEKLAEFRVKVNVLDACAGPVITRYEVQPAVGVRGGQIVNLMKDLARALSVVSIRVVETIPGKTCMGLELPNPKRQMIRLSEVLSSESFQNHDSKLAMVLGKDITGNPVVADLARAPHMLVAGTTGSGKSVGVNAMILSLLYRTTPDEVRLVMIDPKMLELSIYDGIPHLLAPVVTDMKHAANALAWCVGEMERRYRLMSALRVRNLAGYNQKVREADGTGRLRVPLSLALHAAEPLAPLPYIVVVVDEFADLMMVAGKKIEELIARLAQKARAAGIHLILATQRPSVDVITGLIKANIPTRIAFQVSSKIDSRTILDQMGAECLLGQGDMLYLPPGTGYPQRVHGAFVADEEVQAVAEYLKQFGEPDYVEGVLGGAEDPDGEGTEAERTAEENDPLYDEAVEFVINSRRASISAIQRQLRVGYNRAARMVEQMEAAGLVSPMESNGNRTVLVPGP